MASAAGWSVSLRASAQRELDHLDDSARSEAIEAILGLEEDPFVVGSVLLRGYTNLYRVKFYRDTHRLIYTVSEKQRRVIVERVRPRSSASDGFRDPGLPL
jgi:mRNA-degrading endonuclease RelE of RelBE toxin-antitoxin system